MESRHLRQGAWRRCCRVGGATAAVAAAPLAGASGADAVIANLQSEGYDVQINWVNGFDTQKLSDCTVTGVDNPDHSGAAPEPGDTVYVNSHARTIRMRAVSASVSASAN